MTGKTGRELKDELLRQGFQLVDEALYFPAEEFARRHGYSPSSIRTMLKRDQITGAVKVENKWMVSEDADILVKQYAKKNKIKV